MRTWRTSRWLVAAGLLCACIRPPPLGPADELRVRARATDGGVDAGGGAGTASLSAAESHCATTIGHFDGGCVIANEALRSVADGGIGTAADGGRGTTVLGCGETASVCGRAFLCECDPRAPNEWTRDDVAVVRTVLPGGTVVAESLESSEFGFCALGGPDEARRAVVHSICRRSLTATHIPPSVIAGRRSQLVAKGVIDELFPRRPPTPGNDGWTRFYAAYPHSNGIIQLSRPGFSKDGNDAAIYVSHMRGWLDGEGVVYFLHREPDGTWTITDRKRVWIS